MQIVHEFPPFIESIINSGMKPDPRYALFAYGDKLYIPSGRTPSKEIIVHEQVHAKQHKEYPGGPEAWWDRYLQDQFFRINQEAEAYAEQHRFYCQHNKDRNYRHLHIRQLALQLASQLYGNVVDYAGALKLIKSAL